SDLEKARKLIKKIGIELAEDSELKAITIEPLKMQGVEEFGDSGIKLTLKLKTKPGQQSAVRRRALVMIKKAFDENAIYFASKAVPVTSIAASSQGGAVIATAPQLASTTPQKTVAG